MHFENIKCDKMRFVGRSARDLHEGAYSTPTNPVTATTFVVPFVNIG